MKLGVIFALFLSLSTQGNTCGEIIKGLTEVDYVVGFTKIALDGRRTTDLLQINSSSDPDTQTEKVDPGTGLTPSQIEMVNRIFRWAEETR